MDKDKMAQNYYNNESTIEFRYPTQSSELKYKW